MWSTLTNLFGGSFGAALGLFLILGGLVFCAAAIALPFFGLWNLFGKCGVERWRGIIPFYNVWMLTRLTCGKTVLFWIQLALQALFLMAATVLKLGALETPLIILFFIGQACVGLLIGFAVARAFGSGPAFGVGIALLPSVFLFILGLDETEYLGSNVKTFFADAASLEQVKEEAAQDEEPVAQSEAASGGDVDGQGVQSEEDVDKSDQDGQSDEDSKDEEGIG